MANWVTHQKAEHAVRRLAEPLAARGIPVVPIKGLALARILYTDAAERPMLDADLLFSRSRWNDVETILERTGWNVWYRSRELGELCFTIDDFPVELHAELGRPGLTTVTVDEIIARASPDDTLGFPALRVDLIDHLIIVAVNVVKDMFVDAPEHLAQDLGRLVRKVDDTNAVVDRCRSAEFMTGMYLVARWMLEAGDSAFEPIEMALRPLRRRGYAASVRAVTRLRSGLDGGKVKGHKSAWSPVSIAAFTLACATCDDRAIRARCLATVARRIVRRGLGLDADASP